MVVVVVVLLVEPVTPPVDPGVVVVSLPLVPGPPMAPLPEPAVPLPVVPLPAVPLVVVSALPLAVPLVLPLVPAVLPEPVLPVPAGLVVLDELVEPVAPVEPVEPVVSCLSQALSERAPTRASIAVAHCFIDVFIRKLLEVCWTQRAAPGSASRPMGTLGGVRVYLVRLRCCCV